MRVCSLNIWNINRDPRLRLDIAGRRISAWDADIVCLQEVSIDPTDGRPQIDYLHGIGCYPTSLYSSQGRWNGREEGLAILAKYPMLASESYMLPDADGDVSRRLLFTILQIEGSTILIANTHLSYHIDDSVVRTEQCKAVVSCLEKASKRYGTAAIVLAGDFNCSPESEAIDVIRSSALGFRDTFAGTSWRANRSTFSSSNPYVSDELWPDRWIDYVFCAGSVELRSQQLALDGSERGGFASDHMSLEVELELIK